MVTYRRTLTLSLFYKFYLTVLQKLHEQVLTPLPVNALPVNSLPVALIRA